MQQINNFQNKGQSQDQNQSQQNQDQSQPKQNQYKQKKEGINEINIHAVTMRNVCRVCN